MRKPLLFLLLFVIAGSLSAAENLAFDASSSTIGFVGSKVAFGRQTGEFKKFDGRIVLAEGKPQESRVDVDIDMSSVVADAGGLTRHLKNGDFFDVPNHPRATFASTAVKAGGAGDATHTVTGVLELRGVKKSISFPATIRVTKDAVTVASEFLLNRKEFGITYSGAADNLIKDDVLITLNISAKR